MLKILRNILSKKNHITIGGKCHMCGECCKAIHIFDRGNWLNSKERLIELQREDDRYKRLEVIDITQKGYLTLTCRALNENGHCTEYDTRFEFCDSYPSKKIIKSGARLGDECGYKVHYSIPFEVYLDKKLNS